MKEYYHNKEILVTGGCGFIGSHLVKKLVEFEAKVTVLDDLSSGTLDNLGEYSTKITFIRGSITDTTLCQEAVKNKTHIFHLAAFISVSQSIENPLLCFYINVTGTLNLLEAARHAHVQRFIFSSSSAVYGEQEIPCSEEMRNNPSSPYGFSKYVGEQLCIQYKKCYGLETVILRYFNVFGSNQNPSGEYAAVIAKFNKHMIRNEPITIFGDGSQTRDFVPVEQVVRANLITGYADQKLLHDNVFNVATGKSTTILEIFEQLKINYPAYTYEPLFAQERPGDIKKSTANCTRLSKLYKGLFSSL